jgi:hypothetical protein
MVLVAGVGAAAALVIRRDAPARGAAPLDLARHELEQAARRAALCSSANATGTGLRGEYYAEEGCRGTPMVVRDDGIIDFDPALRWSGARPYPRSVRWSGWVKPMLSGIHRFDVGASKAHIVVARQTVSGTSTGIELAAGRFYPISIRIDHINPRAGRMRLEWIPPHGARLLVPQVLLYPPTGA